MAGVTTYEKKYTDSLAKKRDLFARYEKVSEEYNSIKNKETITAQKKGDVVSNAWDRLCAIEETCDTLKLKVNDIEISEGCKTHLIDIYIGKTWNRPDRDIKSKYLEKGLLVEEDCITSYSAVKGIFYEKSVERKDDGFIMGEIDFADDEIIYDTKGSWDIWTFYRNIKWLDNPESNPYFPNMQGYMKLWDKQKSKIVYTLIDTPEHLIEKEKKNLLYDFVGGEEAYKQACEEIEHNLKYSDIPLNRRIIEVPIARNEEYIELIPKVIKACRNYLNNIKEYYYEFDDTK